MFTEFNLQELLIKSGASKSLLASITVPKDINPIFKYELYPLPNKAKNRGVLVLKTPDNVRAYSYRIIRPRASGTGRIKPVLCDFCYTWLAPGSSAMITFDGKNIISHTYYCCALLNCSENVRNLTVQAEISRTNLPEDITEQEKIIRLSNKLAKIVKIISA